MHLQNGRGQERRSWQAGIVCRRPPEISEPASEVEFPPRGGPIEIMQGTFTAVSHAISSSSSAPNTRRRQGHWWMPSLRQTCFSVVLEMPSSLAVSGSHIWNLLLMVVISMAKTMASESGGALIMHACCSRSWSHPHCPGSRAARACWSLGPAYLTVLRVTGDQSDSRALEDASEDTVNAGPEPSEDTVDAGPGFALRLVRLVTMCRDRNVVTRCSRRIIHVLVQ